MSTFATRMTMRASISRGTLVAPDAYGHMAPRLTQVMPVVDEVPCHVWIEQSTEYVDGKSVDVERIKGYFRKGADIKRLDVITQVIDRNDVVLYAGPLIVETVATKVHGSVVSHLQVIMRRHLGS